MNDKAATSGYRVNDRTVGGLRSLKYVYGDTKVRVARYMANASSPWIKKSMDE